MDRITPHEVQSRLEQAFPSCTAHVHEFSGGDDHYSVVVVSPIFAGHRLLKQHRMVLDLFKDDIGTGKPVHALSIQTYTPEQYAARSLS